MLASQQFCVKWNSYSSNLQSVFPRLLNSEHFVDITLACEGQMIKCHKVVLSACSTYFEKLLVQNPCHHPIIFMKDMKHWEVQALVDFMYKGEVNVSQEELNSLLVAAEALQIRGLCGSDNTTRGQQEGLQQAIASPLTKLPAVSLPSDIVLSGSAPISRDTPPQKKRKVPVEEKEQPPSRISVSSAGAKIGPEINASLQASDQFRPDVPMQEDYEEMKDKRIKQEIDTDEHYLKEEDSDAHDDTNRLEQQEDSDSNNREDVHSNALLDQPGPSGIAVPGPAEKAATGGRKTGPVASVSAVDQSYLPSTQHLPSIASPHVFKIPLTSWQGSVDSVKQIAGPPHLSTNLVLPNIQQIQPNSRQLVPFALQAGYESPERQNTVRNFMPLQCYMSTSLRGNVSNSLQSRLSFPAHYLSLSETARQPSTEKRSYDSIPSGGQLRSKRFLMLQTEEEKTRRKLEMARLRQRRFRAKMRLMKEAGLLVVTKGRKTESDSMVSAAMTQEGHID